VHAGTRKGFNVSYYPASQQQQQQSSASAAATAAQFVPQTLQRSTLRAAGDPAHGRITHRLRWSTSDEADAAPHLHFESYSYGGQLLASWKVQSEYSVDLVPAAAAAAAAAASCVVFLLARIGQSAVVVEPKTRHADSVHLWPMERGNDEVTH
jgi:hypothetical protein